MKTIKKSNIIFLTIMLFSQIYSLSKYNYEILHETSEFPKICELGNGDILALSPLRGVQKFNYSKFDKTGKKIYGNSTMNFGYSGSAELVQPKNLQDYSKDHILFFHNKQDTKGSEGKEFILNFDDKGQQSQIHPRKNSLYQKMSAVSLKNGKIVIAGINPISSKYSETMAEIDIYDPNTKEVGNGITFNAYSNYISCYEQTENHIYCVYVSYENPFITKLRIKHILYNYNGIDSLTLKADKVIKTFYTEFNFLKAITFNKQEAIILFQTGNNEDLPPHGNTGQDLYYYHLKVNEIDVVEVLRYEYLFNKCKYIKDPEDYNADIAVLSENRIYAVCENTDNKFQGFMINPKQKIIEKFTITHLEANEVKNPAFAKFDKSLALFHTYIKNDNNRNVVYYLLNYPDCEDYQRTIILPRYSHRAEIQLSSNRIFLTNPYPANRQNEEITFRIPEYSNMSILNGETKEKILEEHDYKPDTNLVFISESLEGNYSIEFTATRQDSLDGLIKGRTCKINFYTPICLEQCNSCTEKGTEDHHLCLGCANESFYEEVDETTKDEGYGKPHNCKRCNISCTNCHGPFIFNPNQTTNCIKCNYTYGYYHYEKEERTCISKETQKNWEIYLNQPLYLDKTPQDKPELWRWRHCHENCESCSGPGTDEDNQCDTCKEDKGLYFWCNQTLGNGIPGSCHNDCLYNGFYLHKDNSDDMNKCCPCLKDCKVCKNETKCEECFLPFYKTPEWDMCNKTCDPCLAYDEDLRECVYCKDRYNDTGMSPRYNLNQTCVYPMPENYHLIDDKCYFITLCDDSCFTCDPWDSAQCTKCNPGYYKEDFYGKEQPRTFRCFSKTQCQGIEIYKPEKNLRVGGVPVVENGEEICLNCKLRNNSFRLPENDFYCGEKIKKTFVDIEDYNKLSKCYIRCKSCDTEGNACFMNCITCLDSANYDRFVYDVKKDYGNCYRKHHHCGIYPYYHDYDIAEALGLDEDNCGEKCDVCLYNFSCTENFPFFNFETHECVEYCPITKVLGSQCTLNNTKALNILLLNPLGMSNPYDFINRPVYINELISSDLFNYFASSYNIDASLLKNQINNYVGTGKIFNLPESKIIFGNNISIKLSSVKLELEELKKLSETTPLPETNESFIDLRECEEIIKKKYRLPDEEDLWIFKGDKISKISEEYIGNDVDYQLFSVSLGCLFPLTECQESDATVTVTNPFNTQNLLSQYQSKVGAMVTNGFDPFNGSSPFYNDICTPFTNENGNDVLLNERRTDYFNENINICNEGCFFNNYNADTKMYSCKCPIKSVGEKLNSLEDEYKEVTEKLPESFYKRHKHSNIEVFKCASQVFSSSGQKKNFGSYSLLVCMASFIGIVVFYFIKGKEKINSFFSDLSQITGIANPPKPKFSEKQNYDDFVKKKSKDPVNIQKDVVLQDEELNSVSYEIALKKDYRGYLSYYWSLIKMKQLFVFTFYTSKDHNLRIAKIVLFILFISFYFAFTALFFSDNIMREIYIYKGNTNAAVHVPNIIFSSLCCIIMNFIVRFVCLSERDINKIFQEKNIEQRKALIEKAKKNMKIKLAILFIISGLLIALCWYYVSAFCAVFKNSQGHYFINLLIAFIVCNIWPCVTSLIPPILRINSLKTGNSECLYKTSQIIAYI